MADKLPDSCVCKDPYRQNDKVIKSDIKEIKEEQKIMWSAIEGKLSAKQFALTMTLLLCIVSAVLAVSITESKNTVRDLVVLVRQTRDDVLIIKGQNNAIEGVMDKVKGCIR